jgi:hypothetical protein
MDNDDYRLLMRKTMRDSMLRTASVRSSRMNAGAWLLLHVRLWDSGPTGCLRSAVGGRRFWLQSRGTSGLRAVWCAVRGGEVRLLGLSASRVSRDDESALMERFAHSVSYCC